jgi:putative DNA primase/helicase
MSTRIKKRGGAGAGTRANASNETNQGDSINGKDNAQPEPTWLEAISAGTVTSTELRAMALKPRQRLLGDWFCEADQGFIFAPRGVGKTWIVLIIARALSEGSAAGPWKAHKKAKVFYIDGEMPPDLMRARDTGLESCTGEIEFLNHEILFERTGKVLNITSPEIQAAITARCVNTEVKVLVLDNLSTLASGMKENEADSWELVNSWLLDLRRKGIAVIIVHHSGRNGQMRGTSRREDAAFWAICLDDAKQQADDKRGARFISRFTKPSRNTQEEIPAYEWSIQTDAASGKISVTYKLAQSLDVLRKLIEEGVTECGQLADEMHVSPSTISKLAKKGMDAGWLGKEGRGYALTGTGE